MVVNLSENQYKLYKKLLKEDQESDSQKKAINLAMKKMDMDKEMATTFIKKGLRTKIQYLNGNKKAGKFTLGIFRLYLDNQSSNDCMLMDELLEKICNNEELYTKFDKNLNGLDLLDLETEVNSNFKGKVEKPSRFKLGKYKIVEINNFSEANDYSEYTSWCVAHSKSAYNNYTSNGRFKFYFLLNEGYENLDAEKCKDEELLGRYGLSMIAVCVGLRGKMKTCTCRWNHNKGGNDHILNKEDIEALIGKDRAENVFVEPESLREYKELIDALNNLDISEFDEDLEIKDIIYDVIDYDIDVDKINNKCFILNINDLDAELLIDAIDNKFKIVMEDFYDYYTNFTYKETKYITLKTENGVDFPLCRIYDVMEHKFLGDEYKLTAHCNRFSLYKKSNGSYMLINDTCKINVDKKGFDLSNIKRFRKCGVNGSSIVFETEEGSYLLNTECEVENPNNPMKIEDKDFYDRKKFLINVGGWLYYLAGDSLDLGGYNNTYNFVNIYTSQNVSVKCNTLYFRANLVFFTMAKNYTVKIVDISDNKFITLNEITLENRENYAKFSSFYTHYFGANDGLKLYYVNDEYSYYKGWIFDGKFNLIKTDAHFLGEYKSAIHVMKEVSDNSYYKNLKTFALEDSNYNNYAYFTTDNPENGYYRLFYINEQYEIFELE